VAFQQNQIGEVRCGNIAGTVNTNSNASGRNTPMVAHALRGEGFDASEDGTGRGTPLIPQAMTVRRLTARECERLQGFPDDYTLIPWRKKQAEDCPDGPRYKALGNSMAVNCMAWIGERIAAVDAEIGTKE
jgi:DNA (cytosine-5)-methyltransferase 1